MTRTTEDVNLCKSTVNSLTGLGTIIFEANKAKGYWPENVNDRNKGELLMLMVSELAEGMEADRKDLMDDHLPQYKGLHVELADCMIRIFDFCGAHQINIGQIIQAKLKYNASRPFKHGKKY